ncbi:hypothetical protein NMG60_11022302 [Bertholletia excelsa]
MEAAAEEAEELPPVRARHIKKRALKNKALSVSFDGKDLRDFVNGFYKRKKKRRKEAQRKLGEAQHRKRIEERKKRALPRLVGEDVKKHNNVPLHKKMPFKKVTKNKAQEKLNNRKDRNRARRKGESS